MGLVLGVALAAGCGGSDEARSSATTNPIGPYGDAALKPLLLTPDDYEQGQVDGSGMVVHPRFLPYCGKRGEPAATWTSEASMLATDVDPRVIRGISETILQFPAGGGAKWFASFKACANTTDRSKLRYTALRGLGDEGLVTVAAEYHQSVKIPFTIAVVRAGDRVVELVGSVGRDAVSDQVIAKALAKLAAG